MSTEVILALVVSAFGLAAEIVRRRWKREDEKKVEAAEQKKLEDEHYENGDVAGTWNDAAKRVELQNSPNQSETPPGDRGGT